MLVAVAVDICCALFFLVHRHEFYHPALSVNIKFCLFFSTLSFLLTAPKTLISDYRNKCGCILWKSSFFGFVVQFERTVFFPGLLHFGDKLFFLFPGILLDFHHQWEDFLFSFFFFGAFLRKLPLSCVIRLSCCLLYYGISEWCCSFWKLDFPPSYLPLCFLFSKRSVRDKLFDLVFCPGLIFWFFFLFLNSVREIFSGGKE